MTINFSKDKYLKLLKEKKSLEKEGKLLQDYDETKHGELISYCGLLRDQILWENRKEYIQILDLFVSKKISLDEFFKQFFSLRTSNILSARKSNQKLEKEIFVINSSEIDIQVNPKSSGFTELIEFLHTLSDLCDPDVTLEMNLKELKESPELFWYGISEEFFRLKIEEYFLPELEKFG